MMNLASDDEIHQIVQRVLNQYLGREPTANAVPASPPHPLPAPKNETQAQPAGQKTVAIGADHGGYELKEILKAELAALGYEALDAGTHSKDSVDYPDFAHEVAKESQHRPGLARHRHRWRRDWQLHRRQQSSRGPGRHGLRLLLCGQQPRA